MNDEKKREITRLIQDAAQPDKPVTPRRTRKKSDISIQGDNNQVAGRDIHNYNVTTPPKTSVNVTVIPGYGVVDEAQKVAIRRLRDEWIEVHNAVKQRPLSEGAAWKRINDAFGVTSYHRLPADRYDEIIVWIRQQIGRLRNMASAPRKDVEWRNARIRAIKARCRNQLGNPDAYRPYIKRNFGAASLADLATDELQRTYTYIMGKK